MEKSGAETPRIATSIAERVRRFWSSLVVTPRSPVLKPDEEEAAIAAAVAAAPAMDEDA